MRRVDVAPVTPVQLLAKLRRQGQQRRLVLVRAPRALVGLQEHVRLDRRTEAIVADDDPAAGLEGLDPLEHAGRDHVAVAHHQHAEALQAPRHDRLVEHDLRLQVGVEHHVVGVAQPVAAPAVRAAPGEHLRREALQEGHVALGPGHGQ